MNWKKKKTREKKQNKTKGRKEEGKPDGLNLFTPGPLYFFATPENAGTEGNEDGSRNE